jgi:CDGSH-type Zn-finger protein
MATKKETRSKTSDDELKIKVSEKGPYLISGRIPMVTQTIITDTEGIPDEWRAGNESSSHENYALCRCGRTKNKPFCDGMHTRVNFDGTETASREPYVTQAEKIDGPALKLTDAQNLCASARFCHRAGGIWDLIPQSGNSEAKKIAIEEAGDCPSGRLVVWDKKTEKAIEPEFERSIGLIEDPEACVSGPIWVRGSIPVESADGKTYEIRNRLTLCRCGKSSNKPFCDSSHFPE